MASGPDIISDLPWNVIECILMRLPIRDAVKTSILSKKWRYKWITIPQLVFDRKCIPISSQALIKNRFVHFVDRVLLLHRGPIHKFKLSVPYLQNCPDIDQWILFLSRNDIKDFSLKIGEDELFKVPSCLFSCQKLTNLELFRCEIQPPPTFKGFSNLKSLILQQSLFADDKIESLISNCPLLERFTMTSFETSSLRIRGPNLKYLRLEGEFKDIYLENTPLLVTLSISLYMSYEIDEHLHQTRDSTFTNVLGRLPVLERLVAETYFVKYLSGGNIPSKLPTTYNHLKNLELYEVGFEGVNEISVTLCLIMNSPNLQHLQISASIDTEAIDESHDLNFWEVQHALDCSFKQLQFVEMTDMSGLSHELEFIKFVLAKSPVLKTMSVRPCMYVIEEGWDMLIKLLRFKRASSEAEIIYIHD